MSDDTPRLLQGSFTQVHDALARRLGGRAALVFGVVYRHCRMSEHICRASLGRLAELTGCNESTVKRHLRDLIDDGYLVDTTPGLRNHPHILKLGPLCYLPDDDESLERFQALQQAAREGTLNNDRGQLQPRAAVTAPAPAAEASEPAQASQEPYRGHRRHRHGRRHNRPEAGAADSAATPDA